MMSVKIVFYILLLLLLEIPKSQGNDVFWFDQNQRVFKHINFDFGVIKFKSVNTNAWRVEPLTGAFKDLNVHSHDTPIIQHFSIQGIDYFSNKANGHIYKLLENPYSIIQMDQLEPQVSKHLAYQFLNKNYLFSLGGVNADAQKISFQRFDFEKGIWENIQLPSGGPNVIHQEFCGYDEEKNIVWALDYLGKTFGETTEYLLFKLDLNQKKWENVGRLNTFEIEQLGTKIMTTIWNGKQFIFYKGSELLVADPYRNVLFKGNKQLQEKFRDAQPVSLNEKIGLIGFRKPSGNIELLSIKDLNKQIDALDNRFYLNENLFEKIGVKDFFLYTFLGGFLFLLYRNEQIRKEPMTKLKLGMKQLLNEKQKQFLLAFKEKGLDFEMGTNELNELIGCDKKNLDNQKLIRTKFINHFNQLFAEYYQIDPLIIRKAAESDRRFVHYSLNPEASEILKEIWKNLNS